MEDLRGLVLDGLYLDLVGRIFPLSVPQCLLKPLDGVHGDRVSPGPLELAQLLHECLGASEQSRRQPHQLPAALLTQTVPVVGQLFHHLAVHFVAQDFL